MTKLVDKMRLYLGEQDMVDFEDEDTLEIQGDFDDVELETEDSEFIQIEKNMMDVEDFDEESLEMGIAHEMRYVEGLPEDAAESIVKDKLTIDPEYYTKIAELFTDEEVYGDLESEEEDLEDATIDTLDDEDEVY